MCSANNAVPNSMRQLDRQRRRCRLDRNAGATAPNHREVSQCTRARHCSSSSRMSTSQTSQRPRHSTINERPTRSQIRRRVGGLVSGGIVRPAETSRHGGLLHSGRVLLERVRAVLVRVLREGWGAKQAIGRVRTTEGPTGTRRRAPRSPKNTKNGNNSPPAYGGVGPRVTAQPPHGPAGPARAGRPGQSSNEISVVEGEHRACAQRRRAINTPAKSFARVAIRSQATMVQAVPGQPRGTWRRRHHRRRQPLLAGTQTQWARRWRARVVV